MLNRFPLDWMRACCGLLLAALATSLVTGCAGYAQGNRLETLDRTVKAYGAAIGRAELERAAFVAGVEIADKSKLEALSDLKVVSYQTSNFHASTDANEATQVARIEFLMPGTMRVRRVEDRQTWRYVEATERWVLTTGLPDFLGGK